MSWESRLAWVLCVAPAGLIGCGQATGRSLGGDPAQSVLCSSGAELEMLDDMEDLNATILPTNGRSGYWFSANDKSGMQTPEMGAQVFPMWKIEPPRDGSTRAVHTYGDGFTAWGAQVGFDLASQGPYDASQYGGISFWARGTAGLNKQLRVNVTDLNTSQYGQVCDIDCGEDSKESVESGATDGICDATRGPCHDYFGADFGAELGEDWRYFRYEWRDLRTRNWSGQNLSAIVLSKLYGLRFQAEAPENFDFWLDDVAFVCH